MEQGSAEWLAWRRQGIGASEVPALLGLDPYGKTPLKLWREKTRGEEPEEGNTALFQQGHEAEAEMRAAHEFETGLEFPPALFEHPQYPFIRASLDGWNAETRQGCEMKLVGQATFRTIPAHHMAQMQAQMLVTATETWTYCQKDKASGQYWTTTIDADAQQQARILGACWEFWTAVESRQAPPHTDQDYMEVEDANLDLALRMMAEQKTTKARYEYRDDVLRIAALHHVRVVNMLEGPAKGAKVCTSPARVTLPKVEVAA